MFHQALALAKSNPVIKIEENLVARFEYFGRAPHIEIIAEPEIARLRSNITFPHYLFNVVVRSQFSTPESAHAHINNVIKDAKPHGTSVFWVDGPSTIWKPTVLSMLCTVVVCRSIWICCQKMWLFRSV